VRDAVTLEALRCPTCQAPVRLDGGARVTECAYCGAQVRDASDKPAPGGPRRHATIRTRSRAG
jgi:hypothetical protein